jgi:hypothetical protein
MSASGLSAKRIFEKFCVRVAGVLRWLESNPDTRPSLTFIGMGWWSGGVVGKWLEKML